MNIAEALERDRWPLYVVEVGQLLEPRHEIRPGMLIPGTVAVAVRPGTEPRPWEAVRELLEEP